MGRTSGVILEMGDGVIHTVPIFEGYASTSAIHRMDFAGRDLTDCLIQLLAERGYAFTTTVGREIVRDIKEKLGYVALNYDEELQKSPSSHGIEKIYTLPDGQQITIGNERFRCAEALFAPRQFGYDEPSVAQMLYSTIMKGEIDTRKDFYCNCLLAGGRVKSSIPLGHDALLLRRNEQVRGTPRTTDQRNDITDLAERPSASGLLAGSRPFGLGRWLHSRFTINIPDHVDFEGTVQ